MKKSHILFISVYLLAIGIMSVEVSGQESNAKIVGGGILNARAIILPKPAYPQELRDAGIGGIVAVNVVIDETGSVISAEAELEDQRQLRDKDGRMLDVLPVDPQLLEAAENAARTAKFSPTLLRGEAIRVKGKIIYNFVADAREAFPQGNMSRVNGGVLNGRALSLPRPEYPAEAKSARAKGAVSVQILIDENGDVVSALAVSGHPLLRSAAENAAWRAKFAPTHLKGEPVKVSGVVTYNFVLF